MYTTRFCPYCMMARHLLGRKGAPFVEVPVDGDPAKRTEMSEKSGGGCTVPQIFIGDTYVGGYDEMAAMDSRGDLDRLLADT